MKSKKTVIWGALLLCLAAMLLSVCLGSVKLPLTQLYSALIAGNCRIYLLVFPPAQNGCLPAVRRGSCSVRCGDPDCAA